MITRAAATLGKGLLLNALAILPAIPAVRDHLHCPAEWWWSYGGDHAIAFTVIEYISALALLDLSLTAIHIWWHGQLARLHAYGIHHTIPSEKIDYTTGQAFGPWEPMMGVPTVWTNILVFGIPLGAAIFATTTMLLFALWAHTNWWPKWYKYLEPVFITPASHRVHHSPYPDLYKCNCGFVFSFWDRVFGTRYHVN